MSTIEQTNKTTETKLKPTILSLTLDDLEKRLVQDGFEKYRAKQIYQFLYQKNPNEFEDIANIPKPLKDYLNKTYLLNPLQEIKKQTTSYQDTYKYLFKLQDNLAIETVLIKSDKRNTLCISSQVGCPLNCLFCATGKMGIKRSLYAGEIVAQFLSLKKKHNTIDNIVFMGMGEPFLNYNNVIKAIQILNNETGANFGIRRITISTSGIVKSIRRLAHENLQVNLAVSLNSPFQSKRSILMPFTKKNNDLREVIKACEYYQEKTNRRITFEYVMIKDLNMRKDDAKQIIKLSKQLNFNLNLIPYNPVEGCEFTTPKEPDIYHFTNLFKYSKIEIVQRKRKGKDISAACGQLATSI